MIKGNRTKGPRKGRTKKSGARVLLHQQRVKPETLAKLKKNAPNCGGIGRAIDRVVELFG